MSKIELCISGDELLPSTQKQRCVSAIKKVVKNANFDEVKINISLVSDKEIKALNKQFRKKNTATDVLSFSAQEEDDDEYFPGLENLLGDLVISIDTAEAQAEKEGHTLAEELAVLTAHGLLHLLGMDHERSKEEALHQAECEMSLLSMAGVRPELALIGRTAILH